MAARAQLLQASLASAVLHGEAAGEWRTLAGDRRDAPAMDAFLQQFMARNGVSATLMIWGRKSMAARRGH
jgi:hypothetical protein